MTTWVRTSHLTTRYVDGEAFIIADDTIENLTPLAASVWRLLSRGRTEEEIAGKLAQRYPGVDRTRIADDVALLLGQFASRRLIQRVSAPAARKAGRRRSTAR